MYPTLQNFLSALDSANELCRISAPVSPSLEISALADLVSKLRAPHAPSPSAQRTDPRFHSRGGPALLFENVQGASFPLLINAYGSYHRMEMALGCHESGHTPGGLDALGATIGSLVKPELPKNFAEIIAKARQFLPLLRIGPKRKSGRGLCQEVINTGDSVDLHTLPIIRCWPLDGDFASVGYPANVNDSVPGIARGNEWNQLHRGKYITLAGIHTIHADDIGAAKPSSANIGMYRVQLLAKNRVAMHWHMHHDGARHWRSWKKLGQRMPVAIALGGESVMPYAATAPLPPGISELLLAGFLNRLGIPLVKGITVPLWVPANSEIVIEGYVSHEAGFIDYDPRTGEPLGPGAVFEGPFGDHTGFYSMPDRYPLVEITAITHRRNAIYPTTVVGLPPQEDYYLGKATERVFFPLLKTLIHDIEDYDLPLFGAFHNCAALQVKKSYPLHGRRLMHSVWGAGQMAWTKTIFVVEHDVDVHDTLAVLTAAAKWCDPVRDVEYVNGPLDILDHAAPRLGAGTKLGFDCTRKINGEQVGGLPVETPPRERTACGDDILTEVRTIPHVVDAALPSECGRGWLFLKIAKRTQADARTAIASLVLKLQARVTSNQPIPPFIILVNDEVNLTDIDSALFHWCAHSDAGRDRVVFSADPTNPAAPSSTRALIIDATPKFPGESHRNEPVRPWPPILKMDEATQKKIQSRWSEYGLDKFGLDAPWQQQPTK